MTAKVLRSTALALAGVLATGIVAGCTKGQSDGSSGHAGAASGGGGFAAQTPAHAQQRGAEGAAKAVPGTGTSPVLADDPVLGEAKIRTADIAVVVKRSGSVAAKANAAEQIAVRAGGEVDADDRVAGAHPVASLVLRVPPDQLSGVLDELSALGREKTRHLSTQDVTAKVADVASRVASARGAIARLRVLYQRTVKIADVIAIEDELSGRESDLESLEAQQRSLAALTATATITVTLTRRAAAPVKPVTHHSRTGFLGGLENGWHAFASTVAGILTGLGAVLPFLVLLLAIGLGVRWIWPRLRPARRTVPAAPPAE